MQYTFDIKRGKEISSEKANPAIQLPKRLQQRAALFKKQPITMEEHQQRMQNAANKRMKVGDFVEKNKERQARASENREKFAENFEFFGKGTQQELPEHLKARAETLKQKWNTPDHTERMKTVLARREKILAERQQKLQAHNTFAANVSRKRNEMVPSLSDHLRRMAKVEDRRCNYLASKTQKNKLTYEKFGETKSQITLPKKLRKRAQDLKREPMTMEQWNARMTSVEDNRQKMLNKIATTSKKKDTNVNMNNIQMFGARKANYVLPAHLKQRAKLLSKDTKTAADLDAKMESVRQNREAFLAQRVAKSKSMQKDLSTTVDVNTMKESHFADMKRVENQRSQFMDNRVNKLKQHLQYVMDVQAKKKSQVEDMKDVHVSDMQTKAANRQSFLSSVAEKARKTQEKSNDVISQKRKYETNFQMIGNQANRDESIPLPVSLQQRAASLQKNQENVVPLDIRMQNAADNRSKAMQEKVKMAKNTVSSFKAPAAPTPSVETKTEQADQDTWKSRFLSFFR